ncbi:MAG: hypothetical protein ACI4VF_06510 [Lachnospirales bacterium]
MNGKKRSYIFNIYEIIYLSKLMGANYIFNIDMRINDTSDNIAEIAEKSLINKNYVFVDFNGNMILNEEIIDYFIPFTAPQKIISVKKAIINEKHNSIYYIKNDKYVQVEQDYTNKGNYVFTLDNVNDIFGSILDYIVIDRKIDDKKTRFIININEYKILKDMVNKKNIDGVKGIIWDLGINLELAKNIEELFDDKTDYMSISFFPEYNTQPHNFDYILYYICSDSCWRMESEADYGDNIKFSSVTEKSIANDLSNKLMKFFGINGKKIDELFT